MPVRDDGAVATASRPNDPAADSTTSAGPTVDDYGLAPFGADLDDDLTGGLADDRGRGVSPSRDVDPRMAARIADVRVERTKRRLVVLVAVVVAIVGAAFASVLARAAVFDVDRVDVQGAGNESVETVLAAAKVRLGTAIWSVDIGAVERRVERLAWVDDATVKRRWPSTITITIREYDASAFVRSDGRVALLGADGRVLDLVDVAPEGLVEIVGPRRVPAVGGVLYPPGVGAVTVALPRRLALEVARIDAGSGVDLVLRSGVRVKLCEAEGIREKGKIALAILDQQASIASPIREINVCTHVPTSR
jgi:cell division septal protein FtsQ